MPIFGQKVRLMSASKPPNMKVQLSIKLEIDNFFDLGVVFFFKKKTKVGPEMTSPFKNGTNLKLQQKLTSLNLCCTGNEVEY